MKIQHNRETVKFSISKFEFSESTKDMILYSLIRLTKNFGSIKNHMIT